MRFAIIENDRVINVVVAEEPLEENWIASDIAKIGDIWDGNVFSPFSVEIDPMNYKNNRADSYPPVSDYLDGIVKGDNAQIQKYIGDCLAVKAKYPKPLK